MIQITPAILTDDLAQLSERVATYTAAGFTSIDIDIAETDFVGTATLQVSTILPVVLAAPHVSWGFHLMVARPQVAFSEIAAAFAAFAAPTSTAAQFDYRIYVHQEADLEFISQLPVIADGGADLQKRINIVIKEDTPLRELAFYTKFPEVQFMTIAAGKQGNKFNPQVLSKVTSLRQMGYTGIISLDGGINLNTALKLRAFDINRVSVGSYFQQSQNLRLDWQKLDLAFNL